MRARPVTIEVTGTAASEVAGDRELALVRAAEGGDEAAFATIVSRYTRQIRGMCWRYVHDAVLVDDLVQETFCRLYLTLDRVTSGPLLSAWIHRIATNLCLDELRRRARRPVADPQVGDEDADVVLSVADGHAARNPERASEMRATGLLMREAMERVPQRQREVLVLRDVLDMGHDEIGRRLGLPPGAVQGILHRARERFKLEYVRLEALLSGEDECVKVAYVIDNFSRGGLRLDRLHAVERHLAGCATCREGIGRPWLESHMVAQRREVAGGLGAVAVADWSLEVAATA